jgi:hypothetical protein
MKMIITSDIESTDTIYGHHDRKGTIMFTYPDPDNGILTGEKEREIIAAITGGAAFNMWYRVDPRERLLKDTQVYDVHFGYDSGD